MTTDVAANIIAVNQRLQIRGLVTGGGCCVFLVLSVLTSRKPEFGGIVLFTLVVVIGAGLSIWFALRLRDVSIDANYLYVSNFNSAGQRIPLADISDVTESFWIKYHPITIHLRSGTPTAEKIVFIPTLRWSTAWRGHPVLEEIKELARRKQING